MDNWKYHLVWVVLIDGHHCKLERLRNGSNIFIQGYCVKIFDSVLSNNFFSILYNMNLLDVVIDQRLQNYVVALAKMSGKSISFLLFLYMPGDENFVEKKPLGLRFRHAIMSGNLRRRRRRPLCSRWHNSVVSDLL